MENFDEADICRRFAPRIRLYGLRHLRDEARAVDLVQEVLVIVLESLRAGRVHDLERLDSFVLGACRMVVRNLTRGESRRARLLDRFGLDYGAIAEPASAIDLDRLRGCLERLPPREHAVVILTYYGERSSAEIGVELGMSEGNVRVVRHRGVAHLQECMGVAP